MTGLFQGISNWANGVITSIEALQLPEGASPRLRNAYLVGSGVGAAQVGKRKGVRMRNGTPITGSPAILANFSYKRNSAGTLSTQHLLVSNAGRFDKLNADDTTSAADSGNASPFTSGDLYPDWVTAENDLFIANGSDRIKFNGTTVSNWGITAPAAPTVADSGVAGGMTGTFAAAVAYYNANTGRYSSASPSNSVTVAAKKIDVTWVASSDAQVTHVAVGVRNTASQDEFFEVTKVAIGTLTYRMDVDPTLLTTVFPTTTENNRPPTGIKVVALHQGNNRVFVSDGQLLYYSKNGQPEAFPPGNIQEVGRNDGKLITGLHYAHGVLMVFKDHALYQLIGDEPASWRVEVVDPQIGSRNARGIFTVNGRTYFNSERGPMEWGGDGAVNPLNGLKPDFSPTAINVNSLAIQQGAVFAERNLILWAIPEAGATRNTHMVVYNYEKQVFESEHWDPMDIASLGVVEESEAEKVFIGGYAGQVFRVWDSTNDGLPALTTKSGSVTASSSTTLTDSAASFTTTGGKLIERYVTVVGPGGTRVQRRRITGNTGTQLTVSPAWSTTPVPNTGWTYTIGGPDWSVDTPWGIMGSLQVKKRFNHLFVVATSSNSAVELQVDFFINNNLQADAPNKRLNITISGSGAKWDQAKWDQAKWGGIAPFLPVRVRIGKTGLMWRARFSNRNPDEEVTLVSIGLSGESLSGFVKP